MADEPGERERIEEIERRLLLEALLARYGYDFSGYAPASVARRLERACRHFGCASLSQLQHRVLHEPPVASEVVGLLTVQVSEMFRDPAYWRGLRDEIVPQLATWPSLKVWIAGCGEGEELYSMAILFREEGLEARTQFYATDISERALAKARAGVFALDRVAQFTDNHARSGGRSSLSDYYTAAYGAAALDKSLRARTVFADHSLASDQVFAEMHLVSCRNVLIYFGAGLQDRAIGLFGDSLVQGGFLGLGAQESLSFAARGAAFRPALAGQRIYRKVA